MHHTKKWRKLLCGLLLLSMILGMFPTALAADQDAPETEDTVESTAEAPPTEPEPTDVDGQSLTRAADGTLNLYALECSASASMEKSTCVSFAYYSSPSWNCSNSAHAAHRFYCSTISYHTIGGTYGYCIEPNVTSLSGQTYWSYAASSAASNSYWNAELENSQRYAIKVILAYSYPNVDYGYGAQAQYAAAQTLIWKIVSKVRYPSWYSGTDSGLYNKVYAVLGSSYTGAYHAILNAISISDGTIPSFAGSSSEPGTVVLTYNAASDCYEGKVTDSNCVLSHFTFAGSGVSFRKSGNTLTISVPADSADSVKGQTITGVSDQKLMTSCDPTIWENSAYQTVVTSGSAAFLNAYLKLIWEDTVATGKIQVEKWASHQALGTTQPEAGAVFQVYLKSAGSYDKAGAGERDLVTIGENGTGVSKELPCGTYLLRQVSGWKGYALDETVYEIQISENGAVVTTDTAGSPLILYNEIWTGRLTICKVDGDTSEPLANAQFTLTGSDGSKQILVTGGDGIVFFENLVYGVTYTWQETRAPTGYLLEEENCGTWTVSKQDDAVEITCENSRRPGEISVTKQDGDGSALSGGVFLLEYLDDDTWKPVFQSEALTPSG